MTFTLRSVDAIHVSIPADIEPSLHPWNKFHLTVVCDLLVPQRAVATTSGLILPTGQNLHVSLTLQEPKN